MKRIGAGFFAGAITSLALLAFGATQSTADASQVQPKAGHQHVVVIGVGGLRWSDISATATPAIWRLSQAGSVGSLATTTVHTTTCPADAWLTLNSGSRAAVSPANSRCLPVQVNVEPGSAGYDRALIPGWSKIVQANKSTGYQPRWGTLGAADAAPSLDPGLNPALPPCSIAIGPGAALALASRSGQVGRYLPVPPADPADWPDLLSSCPLTVVDLGSLPPSPAPRSAAVAADDRRIAAITSAAPAGSIVMVAGMGDSASTHGGPHLRTIVVDGPGYHAGQLTSAATRQPGVVTITDLTPSIYGWLDVQAPSGLVGSPMTSVGRGPLPVAAKTMIGQDTANQVYRSVVGWFFLALGVSEAVVFAIIALVLRGVPGGRAPGSALRGPEERTTRRRVAWYTTMGAFGAAVPAGTFLAGLAPWGQWPHPALWLYGLGLAWAAVIALVAVTGPWRRQSFGPPGFVCAVTAAVIGIDVILGSRLQLGAPFGLSLVEAGRLYGVGNNALGVYAVAGMLTAAWAAHCFQARRTAVAATALVALAVVIASGWPGFGAKVGGTIAMVPAFLVLLAAVAGIKITVRRAVLIAVSGLALVALFAVADYFIPAIGPSHLSDFVRSVLHGGAGGTLHRKISSNLHSLVETWYTPAVPLVALGTGLMLAWPARLGWHALRLRRFTEAIKADPLLRPSLFAVWLAVLLGWLVDDSGVSLAAAALPVALPLAIVLVVRTDNPHYKHEPGVEGGRPPSSNTAGGQADDRRANLWPDRAIAK
ncbi:MAG TPA: hypothetical protein VN767_18100 [Streptosporangiaceae bacterium]|nr:hypothetical protein [Streptosporangiaceae bacterium]